MGQPFYAANEHAHPAAINVIAKLVPRPLNDVSSTLWRRRSPAGQISPRGTERE